MALPQAWPDWRAARLSVAGKTARASCICTSSPQSVGGPRARCENSAPPLRPWSRLSVSLILYSTSTAIAFARYPKTAGCSLTAGFTSALRFAYEVAPGDPHIGVHDAVVRAGLVSQVARTRLGRLRFKLAQEASRLLTGAGRGLGRRAA